MRADEYRSYDGLGLAALVRSGDVTASELLDQASTRSAAVNPGINAIIIPLHEHARQQASQPRGGPFAGVPFLVKDLLQDMAGVPTAAGNAAMRAFDHRSQVTSEIVERWLAAGAVIMGRTNTPELGAKGVTEPEAWGPTRNPWDLSRTPGGSSGGSAAAVAAGIVPLAGGNDGGGSIRIPASHCGLFGLKPTRGRTPWGPEKGEALHGWAMHHVLTRSVRDSAAMLDATHGDERASLARLAPPVRPYLDEVGRDPGRLRIGFTGRSPIDTRVHPEAIAAVEGAAALLTDLGHEVEVAEPDIDGRQMSADFISMWFASVASTVALIKAESGCGDDAFELDTLAMAAFGRHLRADQYLDAYERSVATTSRLGAFFERYDLFMTPSVAHPPPPIGELDTPGWQQAALRVLRTLRLTRLVALTGQIDDTVRASLRWTPFTQLANVTGAPAMSVPLHWTADGLPLGVQLVGPIGGEDRLYRLAGQLEAARPWFDRIPAEAAGAVPVQA